MSAFGRKENAVLQAFEYVPSWLMSADSTHSATARPTVRHDGWTPERQKAFIEALADTGCVVGDALT